MDFHAKERIVGAAVLVALAVWLIPWLLDGPEPEPVAAAVPELQLPLPDEAAPVRTETVDLSSRDGPSTPAQDAVAADDPASEPPISESPPPVIRASPPAEAEAPVSAAALEEAPSAARTPAREASGASAEWSVQAGSFGDRANALQLARRVTDYGFDAEVSEFRSMHRVRVEGYATRAAAEADASALSAHGIPAQVMPAD